MHRQITCLLLGLLAACASRAGAPLRDPAATGVQLREAIERDRATAAYALLAPDMKAELPEARFTELWRENHAELRELAARLAKANPAQAPAAHVALQDGEQLGLVFERGGWHIAGGVFDAQGLATPFDAVLELRRALLRKDFSALLALLSRERRAGWAAAIDKTLEQSNDPLDMRVDVHGDTAIVHLTGGGQIELRREAGRWQLWDVK